MSSSFTARKRLSWKPRKQNTRRLTLETMETRVLMAADVFDAMCDEPAQPDNETQPAFVAPVIGGSSTDQGVDSAQGEKQHEQPSEEPVADVRNENTADEVGAGHAAVTGATLSPPSMNDAPATRQDLGVVENLAADTALPLAATSQASDHSWEDAVDAVFASETPGLESTLDVPNPFGEVVRVSDQVDSGPSVATAELPVLVVPEHLIPPTLPINADRSQLAAGPAKPANANVQSCQEPSAAELAEAAADFLSETRFGPYVDAFRFGYTVGTGIRNNVKVEQDGKTTTLGNAMDNAGVEIAEAHGGGLGGFVRGCGGWWRKQLFGR